MQSVNQGLLISCAGEVGGTVPNLGPNIQYVPALSPAQIHPGPQ